MVWLSHKWKNYETRSFKAESERKTNTRGIGNDLLLDNEQLSNRMLRKAEAVIQLRTSRLILIIERCTNGTQTFV